MGIFALIAQAATDKAADIGSWVGPLVGGGFTTWYAWHTTYRTLPEQAKKFQETLATTIATHREERQADQRLFREERQEAHRQFQESLKTITDHCEEEISRLDSRWSEILKIKPASPGPPH